MKIVVDTNVIISAILSVNGIAYKVLNLMRTNEDISVYYSAGILAEYKKVLAYERLNISIETQIDILNTIKNLGILIEPTASSAPMPDETDRIFYDTAMTAGALLVTFNLKHYPAEPFIMLPADFIRNMGPNQ